MPKKKNFQRIDAPSPDVSKEPTLFVTATSHLDTQWRWTFSETIQRYIPATLRGNFDLFERYPNYTFSFEGAYRYMMAKEYFPEEYETLKKYIADKRWRVCGSAVDAGDTNTVSPESLIRQTLYGNGFWRDEFGVESRDIFLPDCFGFSWVLPSVAVHCGLTTFSTSKLEWGSSYGIPFNVGMWEGPDGSSILALINPGQYAFPIKEDKLAHDEEWQKRIDETGKTSGAFVDFKYFGLGDTGGAPDSESVEKLETAMADQGAPLRVLNVAPEEVAKSLTDEQKSRLPRHETEFLLIEHGVGTYTSHAAMKRWNRKNELIADAAERAAVLAEWLGGEVYPREKLRDAWTRFLVNQMHDILPGTSIPEAYRHSWNDELISFNQFQSVLEHALSIISTGLDTTVEGVPVIVYNSLAAQKGGLVEVTLSFSDSAPEMVRIFAPSGSEVPSQVLGRTGKTLHLLFLAEAPPVGFAVYDVRPGAAPCQVVSSLKVEDHRMENARYVVEINSEGDISRIYDKLESCELLSEPIQIQLLPHTPKEWPAWTIEYKDASASPLEVVCGPADIRIAENGPARVSIEIHRRARGSIFRQRVSLSAGAAGNRVEVDSDITWATKGAVLKAAFPFKASNDKAVYDLGLGTIERGNNHNRLYEVPAQQWASLSDRKETSGAAILTDCKYGWDKPSDNMLRLTLLHTPELTGFECDLGGADYIDRFLEQDALDFGRHRMGFAIMGHSGDWAKGSVPEEADRYNQPLIAWQSEERKGALGRTFQFLHIDTPGIAVKAMKKAERGDEMIIRLQERAGVEHKNAGVQFTVPVESIREVNGMEDDLGPVEVKDNGIHVAMKPYQPLAFAVKLSSISRKFSAAVSTHVELPYNLDVISLNDNRQDGDIDGRGFSLPGELLPEVLDADGATFRIGPSEYRKRNAVICLGQTIDLPLVDADQLCLLAASVDGDVSDIFEIDGLRKEIKIHDYMEPFGQWDDRIVCGVYTEELAKMKPGYVKDARIAWTASHCHSRISASDEAYRRVSLFKYVIPVKPRTHRLTLPNNERIRILAVSLMKSGRGAVRLDLKKWLF